MRYRLPKPRVTRQQETYDKVTEDVFKHIQRINKESDAEALWLDMRAQGTILSQSTFNSRLKLLVDAGRIVKRKIKYNTYHYSVPA